MSSDLTILSTIYSEITDIIADITGLSDQNKKNEPDLIEMLEKMPVTSKLLNTNELSANQKTKNNTLKKTQNPKDPTVSDTICRIMMPKEIEYLLKKTIVGQDQLLKDLSVAAFKYLSSINNPMIKRSNILIMGQSGTGKTETVKALARALERPLLSINSAMLTPTGYRGENLNSIVEKLITMFGQDKAKNAILYFDEFDKLLDPDGSNETSDFKKSVLPELYKILDGDKMVVSTHRGETISLETKGMLVIMTGAFQKMEDSKNRAMKSRRVGLGPGESAAQPKEFSFADIKRSDLVDYGFPVELIGRFSVKTSTKFKREDYLGILRESEASVLKEYFHLFNILNATIEFTDEFLLSIVDKAGLERTGARTMYAMIEERLLTVLYNADFMNNKKIIVHQDTVEILDRDGISYNNFN
jgi:ATP-dependent Clp protease ATP-binding subunit ClpX